MQPDSLINVDDVIVTRAQLEQAPVEATIAVAEVAEIEVPEEKKPAKKAKK